MRRFFLFALFGALTIAPSAFAADGDANDTAATAKKPVLILPTGAQLAAADPANGTEVAPPAMFQQKKGMDARRPILFALHGATAIVQAYDGMTTRRVLAAGGYEANPVMQGIVSNEKGLMAAKIGAAAATIIGAETLWHDNHKVAAIVVSLVANSAMAAVANHNNQVLRRVQGVQ
jgi:hypothetical protein